MKRETFFWMLGLFFVGIFFTACHQKPAVPFAVQYADCLSQYNHLDPFDQRDSLNTCLRGAGMPNFSIKDVHGNRVKTKDLIGNVTVINFWSTTCRPCLAEMLGLNEIVQYYQDKPVRFLGITADTRDRLEKVFFGKRDFDFEIFADAHSTISETFQYQWGLPLTLVFDKEGAFQGWVSGSFDDFRASDEIKEQLMPVLDELLK